MCVIWSWSSQRNLKRPCKLIYRVSCSLRYFPYVDMLYFVNLLKPVTTSLACILFIKLCVAQTTRHGRRGRSTHYVQNIENIPMLATELMNIRTKKPPCLPLFIKNNKFARNEWKCRFYLRSSVQWKLIKLYVKITLVSLIFCITMTDKTCFSTMLVKKQDYMTHFSFFRIFTWKLISDWVTRKMTRTNWGMMISTIFYLIWWFT